MSMSGRIFRFAVVGLLATAVHLAVATFLFWILPQALTVVVNSLSFAVAFVVSFVGHSRFTFGAKGSSLKFLVTSLLGLCVNNGVAVSIAWFTDQKLLAIYIGTLTAPVFVYLLSSRWVFIRPRNENG